MPLVLLFVLLPALELYVLVELGSQIGSLSTFGLILATGALGAALVKRQGLGLLQRIREESEQGRLPALPLLEGLVLLFAGALLVTPGLLTDTVGFLALVPALRARAAQALAARAKAHGTLFVTRGFGPMAPRAHRADVVDVAARPVKDPQLPDDRTP